MKKIVPALFLIMVLGLISAGCGKEKQAEAPQELPAAESAQLPELEQNKVPDNPFVGKVQDTSFEPVPDEMQPISAEEKELTEQTPLSD